jgi:hypothetical protein
MPRPRVVYRSNAIDTKLVGGHRFLCPHWPRYAQPHQCLGFDLRVTCLSTLQGAHQMG